MVHLMGIANPTKIRGPCEKLDWETAVNETVVNDKIRDAKRRHAKPSSDHEFMTKTWTGLKTVHDEKDGKACMKNRKYIVEFKVARARLMVNLN